MIFGYCSILCSTKHVFFFSKNSYHLTFMTFIIGVKIWLQKLKKKPGHCQLAISLLYAPFVAHLQSNNIFSSCSFSSGVELEAEPSSVSSTSLSHFCSIRQANEIALVNISIYEMSWVACARIQKLTVLKWQKQQHQYIWCKFLARQYENNKSNHTSYTYKQFWNIIQLELIEIKWKQTGI